ncbi:hypothetical protein WG66_005360 [Moniliophthora roreri]|nr:hypothetical protein WG66_005360 [Moniliophthora roreri]
MEHNKTHLRWTTVAIQPLHFTDVSPPLPYTAYSLAILRADELRPSEPVPSEYRYKTRQQTSVSLLIDTVYRTPLQSADPIHGFFVMKFDLFGVGEAIVVR